MHLPVVDSPKALLNSMVVGCDPAIRPEVISKYDSARSCFGKQVLHKNRSAPSVGFNHDTRDMRAKTKVCMTKLDEGPRANFTKMHIRMPQLPMEKHVLASGFG